MGNNRIYVSCCECSLYGQCKWLIGAVVDQYCYSNVIYCFNNIEAIFMHIIAAIIKKEWKLKVWYYGDPHPVPHINLWHVLWNMRPNIIIDMRRRTWSY